MSFEPMRAQAMLSSGSLGSLVETCSTEYSSWLAQHPCALEHFDRFAHEATGKLVAVFLDYDGTLTPIVSNPDLAFMSDAMRDRVRRVAGLFPTAIISGRGREKVEGFVQLRELYYAGSHGMDIVGPRPAAAAGRGGHSGGGGQEEGGDCLAEGADVAFQAAAQYAPLMDAVFQELEQGLAGIPGASVEHNKFCVSAHFRNCAPDDWPAVVTAVDGVAARHPELKITRGRKVLEVRPQVDWDKGAALAHLLGELGLADPGSVLAVYIGDDRTDEDAFRVLAERQLGVGILVSTKMKPTAAAYTLRDPAEVGQFLGRLAEWGCTAANQWHGRGGCKGWSLAQHLRLPPCQLQQWPPIGSSSGGDGGLIEPTAAAGLPAAATALPPCPQAQSRDLGAALHVCDAAAAAAAFLKDGYRLPFPGGGAGSNGRCTAATKLMHGPQQQQPQLRAPPPGGAAAAASPLGGTFQRHQQQQQQPAKLPSAASPAGSLGSSGSLGGASTLPPLSPRQPQQQGCGGTSGVAVATDNTPAVTAAASQL
ncbi:hypothetical protein N2152v2_000483 [Parachlorella kessleri]